MSYTTLSRKNSEASVSRRKTSQNSISGGLRIGQPNGVFEREADRVANEVMAGNAKRGWSLSKIGLGSLLQRKGRANGPVAPSVVPPIVHEVVNSAGRPLDLATRSFFEPRFGHDFSQVRIHTDSSAHESAKSVNALAYAMGNHIVFAGGQYAPHAYEGRLLLAHELAHVVQQGSTQKSRRAVLLAPGSSVEREAEQASRQVVSGQHAQILYGMQPWQIGRAPQPATDGEHGEDNQWKTDLAAFKKATTPAQTTSTLLALVKDAAANLDIPEVPLGPIVEPWINSKTGLDFEGYAFAHLLFCFPQDAWKWIAVGPAIIQETPAYTRTKLSQVLQRAADMLAAAKRFEKESGPPPAAPTGACMPTAFTSVESTPFGKYVRAFHAFYKSGLPSTRNLQISAISAKPNFQGLSPNEKLSWFTALLDEIPTGSSTMKSLPGESLVNGVFKNPSPNEKEMRAQFVDQLSKATQSLIYGEDGDFIGRDIGKAATLLNHFDAVWKACPGRRNLLQDALDVEKDRKSFSAQRSFVFPGWAPK